MLDWNDLRFALAIARTGSLSRAARELQVHQTTVGRRLDALEAALGFPLFLRTPSGLVVTKDGIRVLASLEDLAGALTRFEQGARATSRSIVRLAVTEATARQLVTSTIAELLAKHPELAIELIPANTATDLWRGDADLAVRLLKPDDGLIARRLGAVRHGLYGAPPYLRRRGRDLAPGLAGHSVVVPTRDLARGPEAHWLAQHAQEADRALYASSLLTVAEAVAHGHGLSVLPTNLAEMYDDLELLRPLTEIPSRAVWLVLHPDLRRVPRVRLVADAVAAELKRRLGPS